MIITSISRLWKPAALYKISPRHDQQIFPDKFLWECDGHSVSVFRKTYCLWFLTFVPDYDDFRAVVQYRRESRIPHPFALPDKRERKIKKSAISEPSTCPCLVCENLNGSLWHVARALPRYELNFFLRNVNFLLLSAAINQIRWKPVPVSVPLQIIASEFLWVQFWKVYGILSFIPKHEFPCFLA